MVSSGFSRQSGRALEDFAHVQQSVEVILTTPIGSRVMRRDFGSELFDLIARPMTDQVILAVYGAVVIALARWEPRYRVTWCGAIDVDAAGVFTMKLVGVYMPRGHLGDFTIANDNASVVVQLKRVA